MRFNLISGVLLLCGSLHPASAAPVMPTPAEINAIQQQLPPLPNAETLQREMRNQQRDTRRTLDQFNQGSVPAAPAIKPPEHNTETRAADLSALVKDHYAKIEDAGKQQNQGLLYFLSLSMPPASLDRALSDLERSGGAAVLRGMTRPGLKATFKQLDALIKNRRVSILLDPTLFEKFEIRRVPTVVVLPEKTLPKCQDNACNTAVPPHWAISGDVPLVYALNQIRRLAPESGASVQSYLNRLERKP